MHARTFATKTEATRWSKDVETDVRRGDWIDPRLARTSFGEWAHEYLAAIVHPRSVTRGDYEGWLRVHVLPTFGDWPIAQIEQVDVRRFLAERHAAGLAPKSLQKVRLVLRQCSSSLADRARSRSTRATASASLVRSNAIRSSSPPRRPSASLERRERPTTCSPDLRASWADRSAPTTSCSARRTTARFVATCSTSA